jgi:hypothetical protein
MEILQYASFHQGYSQKHVAVTQHPQGSADCVFLDACRVSSSQQYHRVHYIFYPLEWNENKDKIKYKELFPKNLDTLFSQFELFMWIGKY